MKQVIFYFLKTGLQTTVQDFGRIGFQHFGVPVSGVMDKVSAKIANELVGNPPESPVLEITLLGPKIEVEGTCQIAITGANLSPQVNQQEIPLYQTIHLKNGDILSFGKVKNACRAYLAVGGDWQVKKWLGSYSATTQNPETLTPNSTFQKGSKLIIQTRGFIQEKKYDFSKVAHIFDEKQSIRVLPAPEFEQFSRKEIAYFFSQEYKINPQSNRMGYRLDAENNQLSSQKISIISSGILIGTVQIPPSQNPILLLADAQTTGGYPRIVKVIEEDLPLVAQRKLAGRIRFKLV